MIVTSPSRFEVIESLGKRPCSHFNRSEGDIDPKSIEESVSSNRNAWMVLVLYLYSKGTVMGPLQILM